MTEAEDDERFALVVGKRTRVQRFVAGEITVDDLDDEELVRGQLRGSDGKFHGGGQKMIPRSFHLAIQRRLQQRGFGKMQESFFEAIDTMASIMRDPEAENRDRMAAARFIIERVAGKTPDKVEVAVELKPWEQLLQGIIKSVPDAGDDDTVDAEVVT